VAVALALVCAVLLDSSVDSPEWEWISLTIAAGSGVCVVFRTRSDTRDLTPDLWLLAAAVFWMILQWIPLPSALVEWLSPGRWRLANAARLAAGLSPSAWIPLSIAPSSTFGQLLSVLPSLAAFVAARELMRTFKDNQVWLAVPIVLAGAAESLLGIAQYFENNGQMNAPPVAGSYANYDHFSGLLEMSLPIAAVWAVALWNRFRRRRGSSTMAGVGAAVLIAAAGLMLAGIVASASRMGFLIALTLVAFLATLWTIQRREAEGSFVTWRAWLIPIVLPLLIALLIPTNALLLRFAGLPGGGDLADDGRVRIWIATVHLIKAFPITGVGLGTYQQGVYPFELKVAELTAGYAHNDYLQFLAELGFIGTVPFLVLGLYLFRKLARIVARPNHSHWPLAVGLLGAIVALGLHSLVDFNLYVPANALVFAWIAGMAASPGLESKGR